jgi:hypothetical protein
MQGKEDRGRPIQKGDAIARIPIEGVNIGWTGQTAASDPFESVPGIWNLLVRNATGSVFSAPLDAYYRCDVPFEVITQVVTQAEVLNSIGETLRDMSVMFTHQPTLKD